MSQSRSYSGDAGACPERQMLSVYLDGELPSPWREKLETHLAGCQVCGEVIASYGKAFPARPADEAAHLASAGERVWRRLEESRNRGTRTRLGGTVWRRRISLPVPAAAAVLIVLGLALAGVLARPVTVTTPDFAVASENGLDPAGADIGSVVEYLSGQDGNGMVIRLPESLNFSGGGELTVVRAADYTRQMASWQGRRRN